MCAVLLGLMLAVFSGCASCEDTPVEPPDDKVSVSAVKESVTVTTEEAIGYNYAALFEIKSDGEILAVLASYIDTSALKAETGEYFVVCTYKGKSASVKVIVTQAVDVEIAPTAKEVTIETYEVESYDFTSLFDIKVDGKSVDVVE